MTRAMMNAIAPHPNGIIGLSPGMATSSLAVGGAAVGGLSTEVMNAKSMPMATKNIENRQTHSATSP